MTISLTHQAEGIFVLNWMPQDARNPNDNEARVREDRRTGGARSTMWRPRKGTILPSAYSTRPLTTSTCFFLGSITYSWPPWPGNIEGIYLPHSTTSVKNPGCAGLFPVNILSIYIPCWCPEQISLLSTRCRSPTHRHHHTPLRPAGHAYVRIVYSYNSLLFVGERTRCNECIPSITKS